ncbi:MAG: ribonuclease HIII [Bacilli bacterium]|nr:ribonuclease HIII [Bacilli bacterium]
MSHTIKVSKEELQQMLDYYSGYLIYNDNPHTIAKAKLDKAVVTFYATNTVLFQGLEDTAEYNIWADKFALTHIKSELPDYSAYENLTAIGCDEVGTGDYFGPIVVCSAFVRSDQITELKKLGVKDSKLLLDDAIIDIALKLRNIITYSILVLSPAKFNELHKSNSDNLNFIKASLHNKAINSILKKLENVKYDAILIDEFTPKEKYLEYLKKTPDVNDSVILVPKGEKVHISIAAASILARAAFLKAMKELSKEVQVNLLKGASASVDRQAIGLVKSYGFNILNTVAKLKFANTEKIKKYIKDNNIKVRDMK